jgi:hypothetical protein
LVHSKNSIIFAAIIIHIELYNIKIMMTIEEYRAEVLQALLEAKNEDGTPAITPKEAQEALNGFTDDELQDGILWNSPQDVADIILEG